MAEFINLISCPITKKIFYTPTLASDGIIYEAEAILNIIESKNPSPISGKILDKDLIVVINLKSLIDLFLKSYENMRQNQYVCITNISNLYYFSKAEILSIFMERSNYNSLLKYDNFKIEDIDTYCFADFLKYASYDIIVHFIEHCDNLNYIFPDSPGTWSVANYVFKYGTPETVKYLLTKYPDLDYENESSEGWRPIHQIASSHDGEAVKLLIDIGVNILSKTSQNISGFEYIITSQNAETITYTIDHMNFATELDLSVLLIRVDDNENLKNEEREMIKDMIVTKYNY